MDLGQLHPGDATVSPGWGLGHSRRLRRRKLSSAPTEALGSDPTGQGTPKKKHPLTLGWTRLPVEGGEHLLMAVTWVISLPDY